LECRRPGGVFFYGEGAKAVVRKLGIAKTPLLLIRLIAVFFGIKHWAVSKKMTKKPQKLQ